jgi:hypothetical protein
MKAKSSQIISDFDKKRFSALAGDFFIHVVFCDSKLPIAARALC